MLSCPEELSGKHRNPGRWAERETVTVGCGGLVWYCHFLLISCQNQHAIYPGWEGGGDLIPKIMFYTIIIQTFDSDTAVEMTNERLSSLSHHITVLMP